MMRKKTSLPQRRLQDLPIVHRQPKTAERLVGLGFRTWMQGYLSNDIACWATSWNLYAKELGPEQAKQSITELACWVRAIHASAARKIEVYPASCAGFCQDECLAISMVAACQNNVCPALKACAFALMGDGVTDEVLGTAERFADTLGTNGIVLEPGSIANAIPNINPEHFSQAAN